jgi:hypothetical protein
MFLQKKATFNIWIKNELKEHELALNSVFAQNDSDEPRI